MVETNKANAQTEIVPATALGDTKSQLTLTEHVEGNIVANLVYDDAELEPELHARTYIAFAAMCIAGFTALFTIQGPASVLTQIAADLENGEANTWISTSLTVPQAVLAPVIVSAADTFQVRKWLIVVLQCIAIVGAAIVPGSSSVYRVIAGQTLLGFGLIAVPLTSVIPSEILPRRWRPMAQALYTTSASAGAVTSTLMIGALTKANPHKGWRIFYWVELSLWVLATICIVIGYRPPVRHTKYDHLSWPQKLMRLDLIGSALLTAGLTLFLVGLGQGGGLYAWTNRRVLATLICGIVGLIGFAVYEWKGTTTGILHHELFRGGAGHGRTFALLLGLMFAEGLLMFAFVVFYPILTTNVFETDVFLIVVRSVPFWAATLVGNLLWGYLSTKWRTIRSLLLGGFVFITAGMIGFAALQPNSSTVAVVFAAIAGFGFGSPIVLISTGVQLTPPHELIGTATAVVNSVRGIGAGVFIAIFSAAFSSRLNTKLPAYLAAAAAKAGLPATSIPAFVGAFATNNQDALLKVPGIDSQVIGAGAVALKQAFTDSLRVVYIIAAPFGATACIGCLFLGSLKKTMNYRVDAPVEELHAKSKSDKAGSLM